MKFAKRSSRFPERGGIRIKGHTWHPGILPEIFQVLLVDQLIAGSRAVIYLIADGRRDMQSVLAKKLPGV
jgi:hypothetical protein